MAEVLNRALFKTTGETPGQMPIRIPLMGKEKAGEFISEKELNLVKQKLGLTGDDWHDYVQHPRVINPRTVDAKKNLEATLNRNMSRIGSHEWIAKEEDGLYVVAKRSADEEHYFSFLPYYPLLLERFHLMLWPLLFLFSVSSFHQNRLLNLQLFPQSLQLL